MSKKLICPSCCEPIMQDQLAFTCAYDKEQFHAACLPDTYCMICFEECEHVGKQPKE
jgi:hypothetical protein